MNVLIIKVIFFILSLLMSLNAFSQVNNSELQKMADDDQNARRVSPINWMVLNKEDSLRRVRVFELMKEGKVKTAKDYFNSGIIFQHGNDIEASEIAVSSFARALELDSTLNRWWYAAAVDRDLMRKKKPQIYGTQFYKDRTTAGKWKRYEIDTTKITDEQRKYYSVETLAEQKQKEWLMNLKPLSDEYRETQSIEQTIVLIRKQHAEGRLSAFSLENEINTFGYELLDKNKPEEALKIFELNVQLYPKSFNTYDSYGEILLKSGKKKEGLKAYKKSLKLNPDNENAKKVLEANP